MEPNDQLADELGREDDAADRERNRNIDRLNHVKAMHEVMRKGMKLTAFESFTLCEIAEELLTAKIED